VRQHLPHQAVGDLQPTHFLALDGFVVHLHRNRCRTGILAAVQGFTRPGNTSASNGVDVSTFAQSHLGCAYFHQFFPLEGFQQGIHDPGKGQGNLFGDFKAGQVAFKVHDL